MLFFVFTISVLISTPSFAVTPAEEGASKIQKAYENIKDIQGNFIQKSHIKDLKRTDTYKGEFFIKMPMNLKWSYKGDTGPEVVIHDDVILIYQKKEKQIFKGKFTSNAYGQTPIALLSGFGKIHEEFTVSKKGGKLILKPKKPIENILSIEIAPSEGEFPIRSFAINDSHSNKIEIILNDVKINTGLKDNIFEISLPKDIPVYEYNP
jgi:outer membrane lipoprotein-sorting protein